MAGLGAGWAGFTRPRRQRSLALQLGADKLQQFQRAVQDGVCFPVGGFGGAAIAPGGGDGDHACGVAGLDVAQVVAYIPAMGWGNIQALGGFQQGGRMWFCVRRGVSGYGAGAVLQAQQRHQRVGEPGGLVGDYAPGHAQFIQALQQRRHVLKQAAVDLDGGFVVVQEFGLQRFVFGIFRGDIEAGADQAARAGGCVLAQAFIRGRQQMPCRAHFVQRCCQVGRGVGQGAVEVKQDCFWVLHGMFGVGAGHGPALVFGSWWVPESAAQAGRVQATI